MANQYVNKVQTSNGNTLIDLTADTVTADKLMQGYTAHDRSGALITGTAAGGGSVTQDQDGYIVLPPDGGGSPSVGGLVYESGTWTPSDSHNNPIIYFADQHTNRPYFIILEDVTGTAQTTTNALLSWTYIGWFDAFGETVTVNGSTNYYGRIQCTYSSGTTYGAGSNNLSSITGTSTSSVERYVTNTQFQLYSWASQVGRTYKWIAVWAPTT